VLEADSGHEQRERYRQEYFGLSCTVALQKRPQRPRTR
jgi:hypothetical protein